MCRKQFSFILLFVIANNCYSLAIRDDFTDHYYDNPKSITVKLYSSLFVNSERLREQTNNIEYKELMNG
jgi:hypothetical protein